MKILFIFSLIFLSQNAYAQTQAIQEGMITKLFVSNDLSNKFDSQRVIVRLEGDVVGC